MDPNATLLAIREAVTNGEYETAATLFDGLDYWLTRGGFLPTAWDRVDKVCWCGNHYAATAQCSHANMLNG